MMKQPPLEQRFWAKVNKDGPVRRFLLGNCWEWTGCKVWGGYGLLYVGKKGNLRAHRASWLFHYGEIPKGKWVLHRCDNAACVRPEHLWLGTTYDNNADRDIKNRTARGFRNGVHTHPERVARGELQGASKLTESNVRMIRELAPSMTKTALAKMFSVTRTNIGYVISRETWSHVRP